MPQGTVARDAPTAAALIGRSLAIPRRGRLDDELREEIEQHIELRRDQLIDAGVDPHEALVMARRQFGNVTRVREDTRAMWSFPAVETIVQDLRYGLLAYSVTRRVPELGLRMALGASRGTVRWMVMKQSLMLVGAGLAIGVPAAIAGNRFVSSLLFEVSPRAPLPLAAAAGVMIAVSLLAAFVPAHRASRVEPALALRGSEQNCGLERGDCGLIGDFGGGNAEVWWIFGGERHESRLER